MRLFSMVLTGYLVVGCSTDPTVKTITVPEYAGQSAPATLFVFSDERPEEQKKSRTDEGIAGTTVHWGDTRLNPSAPELLKSALWKTMNSRLEGKHVVLNEFSVSVWNPPPEGMGQIQQINRDSYNATGNLAAYLPGSITAGIATAATEKTVRVRIAGVVDGREFSSMAFGTYRMNGLDEQIQLALSKALNGVVSDIQLIVDGKKPE